TYALDINPLFDVTQQRQGMAESKIIFNLAMCGSLDICITPEFSDELQRHADKFDQDPVLALASALPSIPLGNAESIKRLSNELREIIFPNRSTSGKRSANDNSDLNHIAYCIEYKLSGFITREKTLLRSSDIINRQYGIKILSPEEVIQTDTKQEDITLSTRTPETLSIRNIENFNPTEIGGFLESFGVLDSTIKTLHFENSHGTNIEHVGVYLETNLIGYASWQKPSKIKNVINLHFYLDETAHEPTKVIDNIFERVFRCVPPLTSARIELSIHEKQTTTKQTALSIGFLQRLNSTELSKVAFNGFINESNWGKFRSDFSELSGLNLPEKLPKNKELLNTGVPITGKNKQEFRCYSLFDFETLISPGFLLPKGRECLLLPIKETYASQLLGELSPQRTLLPSEGVSLLLEKAYFRSTARKDYFKKGTTIAFYVSGKKSIQEIVGLARITYSELLDEDQADFSLQRQGVLPREKLAAIANSEGKLHAFTFDNFNEFPSRLDFKKAKSMGVISDANLITVEKLPYEKFKKIIDSVYKS
ncbi:MAG: hypothetical protein COA42_22495, partial [Alteromonadaceae bacterium]